MANQLKMAMIDAIVTLLERGWSYRRIARELGIHRETVARYDRERSAKPAISTPGSEPVDSLHGPPVCRPPGRLSACEPYAEIVRSKLEVGLTAQRIFQDLRTDTGFTGSYSAVKRYVHRVGEATPLPFRRMECAPGEEAQVDFGAGPWVTEDGHKYRSKVLRVVLSHSRKGYSEAIRRETTESFIRSLENAFRSFGGVPATLVLDNLKAAVKNPDWFDPDLNPKIASFARHYGIAILPTKSYTPRHKGKIESGIGYVKSNALKGRFFATLVDVNAWLAHWERTIADTRIHGTTKKQVRELFECVERGVLRPLPKDPLPFFHEARRKVHRDGHVEVARAYYSVPPEYLGHELWVRYDTRLIRIYNDRFEQIATHARAHPGRFHTDPRHISDKKISGVERGIEYLLSKASRIGTDADLWARAMIEERGIEGVRVLQGFVSLASRHPASVINRASRVALASRLFRLRPLRELCKRLRDQEPAAFIDSHPLIRPLSEYQELLVALDPNPGGDPS